MRSPAKEGPTRPTLGAGILRRARGLASIVTSRERRDVRRRGVADGLGTSALEGLGAGLGVSRVRHRGDKCRGAPPDRSISFEMVRSLASVNAGCVPDAKADVSVTSKGSVEVMNVKAEGLPPKTEFDLFVIQVPNGPFGLSWYQGDVETNGAGKANATFVGRFSIETFIVAPGGRSRRPPRTPPMPTRTRRPRRSTPSTWDCGSTLGVTRSMPAAGQYQSASDHAVQR